MLTRVLALNNVHELSTLLCATSIQVTSARGPQRTLPSKVGLLWGRWVSSQGWVKGDSWGLWEQTWCSPRFLLHVHSLREALQDFTLPVDELRGKRKIAKSIVSLKFEPKGGKKNPYLNFCWGFWKTDAGALVREAAGVFEFLPLRSGWIFGCQIPRAAHSILCVRTCMQKGA